MANMIGRLVAGGLLLAAVAAPLSACSSGSDAAGASPSASPQQSGASARPEAWVRGTKVVLTNDTGSTVKVGSVSGYGDKMPETDETALPDGGSRTESEEWRTSSGTSVAFRIVYSKDDVLEFRMNNPAVGTPEVVWRKGYSVYNWSSDGQWAISGSETFDENTTKTLDMEGHTVQVTRGGDDDDNKNWTVQLQ